MARYGFPFQPLDQGANEFRHEREKLRTGVLDEFDLAQQARKDYVDSRPAVSINESLVVVEKRPQNSNWFSERRSREWVNRPPVIGQQRQQFGVDNATPARPVATQVTNFEFNRAQLNRTGLRQAI